MTWSGIVLAGGFSRRFRDGDKAIAKLDGTPLIRHVAERAGEVVDELVVNCRVAQVRDVRRALDGVDVEVRLAIDDVPDRGPVAGMAKGLRVANGEHALVTACDVPRLDPAFLEFLFEQADDRGAIPVYEDRRQPLPAVYGTDHARESCHAVLADGDGSLQAVLDLLDPAVIPETTVRERASAASFENVNTRGDLCDLRCRIGASDGKSGDGTEWAPADD